MSHNDHPTLALPGGTKMETLLVCVDGKSLTVSWLATTSLTKPLVA